MVFLVFCFFSSGAQIASDYTVHFYDEMQVTSPLPCLLARVNPVHSGSRNSEQNFYRQAPSESWGGTVSEIS